MYERIASNVRKSWMLIIGFMLFVILIGWVAGMLTGFGHWLTVGAVVFAVAMTWGSYFASDKIALSMSKAYPADPQRYAQLHNIVEGLAIAGGLPKPRVFIVNDTAPNAFATGRNPEHAAIAVTGGLLAKMDRNELEGVLAHELAHVKNRDTLVMTLAVTLVGIIVLLADWLLRALFWGGIGDDNRGGGLGLPFAIIGVVLLLISPFFAQMMQFAISRQREFLADAEAVNLTRYPQGLIGALEKLRGDQTVVKSSSRATAHLWIEAPIAQHAAHGKRGATKSGAWLNRMFNTHPPLDDRINALRQMAFGAAPEAAPTSPPPSV